MGSLPALLLISTVAAGVAQQPIEGVVERPDVKLHYTIYGEAGPTVVILAGGPGGTNAMLQPFADHLKDRFRCVILERRGTDRSKLERYDERTISFDAYVADIEAVRIALKQGGSSSSAVPGAPETERSCTGRRGSRPRETSVPSSIM